MKQNEPEKVSCNQLIASITEELEATLEVKEAAFGRQVSLNTLAGDGSCCAAALEMSHSSHYLDP